MMEWGGQEDFLREVARTNQEIPEALLKKPLLLPHLHFVWQAFLQLSRERTVGMGPGAIKAAEVQGWCDLQGITDPSVKIELYELIVILDSEWCRIHGAKQESRREADQIAVEMRAAGRK